MLPLLRGVQVREGDYFRPETLGAALADVNRLLLVPSSEQSAVLHRYPWRPCGENARICRGQVNETADER
jgi:hypothetical protein